MAQGVRLPTVSWFGGGEAERAAPRCSQRNRRGTPEGAPPSSPSAPAEVAAVVASEGVPATASTGVLCVGGMSSSSTCVEVNVGGEIFRSSAATLRNSPFLASLLSDDFVDDLRDADGRLFIDRDPDLFAAVLRLLRGYDPEMCTGKCSWSAVKAEADFYQIPLDLLREPVEVVLPPDILIVRHLYSYHNTPSTETLHPGEVCMYSLNDLPPDLKTQIRIDSVLVNRHQCGSKTVFVINRQVLEEAGFIERSEGVWERTERKCYHKKSGLQLLVPKHPMEVDRDEQQHYLCITYVVPLVGPVVSSGNMGVVGVQAYRRPQ
mmetsp:Transcript_137284/g.342266  ORF Transcript_137284/g.342266 Transcript_137284/m.342266 type:complete len:320 (-) Transcript_137284:123-1082(-)